MKHLIASISIIAVLLLMCIALSTPTVHRKPYMIVNGDTIHKPIIVR